MKEISVNELKQLKDTQADFQLIDVREPHEAEICGIGGELIPMATVMANLDKISKNKRVIVHCRSGKRSGAIVEALERAGYSNVENLAGGILEWAKVIDPSMDTY